MTTEALYPPLDLANRVGSLEGKQDPLGFYDLLGRESKTSIVSLLPEDWKWEGAQVLDFGCGAGRTLRHFLREAEAATFWGCDIDRDSIEWLREHLSPPLRVFVNDESPPMPFADGSLDLVYAVSVFTHLTETWSAWLAELHRVLTDDGVLIATFIGPSAAGHVTDEPWDPDRIGMNVLKPGQNWDRGGPLVLHSPWWIEAHWGRAFDIVDLRLDGFGLPSPEGQGVVSMRKRAQELDPVHLERPEEQEPREVLAALNNVSQLTRELVALREDYENLGRAWRGEVAESEEAKRTSIHLRTELERMAASKSWRITRPLRALGRITRALRRGR